MQSPASFRFGAFEVNPRARQLRKHGFRIKLHGQPFQILLLLLERRGEVVTREEMRHKLWPEDTFVDFEHSLNTAVKKLREALGDSAEHPRYIETLPRMGYCFIASVESVPEPSPPVENLGQKHAPIALFGAVAAPAPSKPAMLHHTLVRFKWRLGLLFAISFALVMVLDLGRLRNQFVRILSPNAKSTAPATISASVKIRPSIAVLGFKNLSGRPEEAWLSTALSEMLSTELGIGGQLRMIPGENIARLKSDLSLPDAASYTKESLVRIRQDLGNDLVVVGSYTALGRESGGQIRLDLRVQNATTGETTAVLSRTGTETKLFELVSQAGAVLRQNVGIGPVSAGEATSLLASLPQNPEATRLYAEGLAKLRVFDALGARDLLIQAVTADPNYPLAHSALAEAWTALGYDSKAREEAKRAFELADRLPREERISVEARYRESTHEWEKAVENYRSLFTFFPDNLDYGLQLAKTQTSASKGRDALATVGMLRRLPPPAGDDPRIDLADAAAWGSLAEYNPQIQPLARAAEYARAHNERLLLALALQRTCFVLGYLGDATRAANMSREAKQIYMAAGDRQGEANALRCLGDAVVGSGPPIAIQFYQQALAIERKIGNITGQAAALNEMAIQYGIQGDHATAKKFYVEALDIYRQVNDKVRAAAVMGNVASELMLQGHLAESERMYGDVLKSEQDLGNKGAQANTLYNMGLLRQFHGDLSGARSRFEQALSIWRDAGDKFDSTYALYSLGEIAMAQDDLVGARKMFDDSLALRQAMQEKVAAGETLLDLAELGLQEGQAAPKAEAVARETMQLFHTAKVTNDEAMAYALLARALLVEGKSAEATRAVNQANVISSPSQDPSYRLTVAVAAARVYAAKDQNGAPQAIQSLKSTIAQADTLGYSSIGLEARLVLGEIEMKSGKTAQGQAQLAALEKDATSKGFLLIARKAHAAVARE
jgi:eukaryotic-like serine/threonine-protein kinase